MRRPTEVGVTVDGAEPRPTNAQCVRSLDDQTGVLGHGIEEKGIRALDVAQHLDAKFVSDQLW